jgi:hypothetical protein
MRSKRFKTHTILSSLLVILAVVGVALSARTSLVISVSTLDLSQMEYA